MLVGGGTVVRIAKHAIIRYGPQVKILPHLARKLAPLRIPEPSHYLAASPAFPYGLMAYPLIEGTPATRDMVLTHSDRFARQLATALLALHRLRLPTRVTGQHLVAEATAGLNEAWAAAAPWLHSHLTTPQQHAVHAHWQHDIDFLVSHHITPMLIQGDPWYANLLTDDDGNLTGMLDFDKFGYGDPAIDFGVQRYASLDFADHVMAAYIDMGGQPGPGLTERVAIIMRTKVIKDLAFCLSTGRSTNHVMAEMTASFL